MKENVECVIDVWCFEFFVDEIFGFGDFDVIVYC